ncbi:MAG: FmdE family protein [Candidatus Humimicrobiaceae bacterium]
MRKNYRQNIDSLIKKDDLEGLLEISAQFHGHICSYSAYGVKAAHYGMKKMGTTNTGMEEIIAIVETNNCFSDGVQAISGCTFGNNSLIFKDLGKTAVTFTQRDEKNGIRISLKEEFKNSRQEVYPEAYKLFEKIVKNREEVSESERDRFFKLFEEMAIKELGIPAVEMFKIEEKMVEVPEFAPIYSSALCKQCGESIMETRARINEGEAICLECSGQQYFVLDGSGIKVLTGKDIR